MKTMLKNLIEIIIILLVLVVSILVVKLSLCVIGMACSASFMTVWAYPPIGVLSVIFGIAITIAVVMFD